MVVKEFIDGVLACIADAAPATEAEGAAERAAQAPPEGDSDGAEGDDPADAPRGRAAMGLDSDSDEEELAAVPAQKQSRRAANRRKKMLQTELRCVSYAGMELLVKPLRKCKGLAVPLEDETLIRILKHLRKQMQKGEVPKPDAAKQERRKEAESNREDEDAGRIRWLFQDHCYQVLYHDEAGVKHKVAKPFKVSRSDAFGRLLEAEVFKEARLSALKKARAFWNENDKSDMARYEEPNDC